MHGAAVRDLDAQPVGRAVQYELPGATGVQTGIGDHLGHQEQHIVDDRLLVLVAGGNPLPVGQRLPAEVAAAAHDTLRAAQRQPAGLPS
ncbi:hypothetical protein AS594_31040 [Streptomyces agglomeratus]|uniref:Uncharacterized protein n=1 Tax=Streptomyces agglomeratus TaxID=285458 RepID=A0A1E5PFE7_9ACTN|nr:hypothetical protein AS594_31040 [Streptomyces agglomeratus]